MGKSGGPLLPLSYLFSTFDGKSRVAAAVQVPPVHCQLLLDFHADSAGDATAAASLPHSLWMSLNEAQSPWEVDGDT